MAVVDKTVLLQIPFWLVGEFTTHFRTYFSWDWDVHWGYDLDFDPWPLCVCVCVCCVQVLSGGCLTWRSLALAWADVRSRICACDARVCARCVARSC